MTKKIKLNGPVVSGGNSWIYDWLGMETISPKRVIAELDKAAGDDVELYINSGGGSVFAGSEIYTALKEYRGKITSKVTGVAASAATFFVLASDEVYVSPLAQLMIHKAAARTDGDSTAHSSGFELLDGADRSIAKVYQTRTKLPENEILDLMDKTTWMNAEKAVQLGFADGVLFDEESDVSNSLSMAAELPQEVIDKLKNELLKNILRDNPTGSDPITIDPINQAKPIEERNDKAMNLEELKAQHPDLYQQVLNEGAKNERDRVVALNALATAPGAAEIVAKAIEEGKAAGDVAMEIVKASVERVKAVGKDRMDDSKDSGVADVPADEAPESDKPDYDAEAESILEEINNLKGEK